MTTRTILLVEDNAFDAKVFRRAVHDTGIKATIQVARDGIEAIDILVKRLAGDGPIIVTDIKMPRMDGLELLQKIRSTAEIAHLPVFVVTTSDLPADHDKVIELGIEGYIRKTSDEIALVDPIVAYLERRGGKVP